MATKWQPSPFQAQRLRRAGAKKITALRPVPTFSEQNQLFAILV